MEPTLRNLSTRELQVAGMVACGYSVKETADKLCISSLTVRTHMKNIYRTSGCRKSTDLTRVYILENGYKVPVFDSTNPKRKDLFRRICGYLAGVVSNVVRRTRQKTLYNLIMQ